MDSTSGESRHRGHLGDGELGGGGDGVDGNGTMDPQELFHDGPVGVSLIGGRVVCQVDVLRRPFLPLLEPPHDVHVPVQAVHALLDLVLAGAHRGHDLAQGHPLIAGTDDVQHPLVQGAEGAVAVRCYVCRGVPGPHVPHPAAQEPSQQEVPGAAHLLPVLELEPFDAVERVQGHAQVPEMVEQGLDGRERPGPAWSGGTSPRCGDRTPSGRWS